MAAPRSLYLVDWLYSSIYGHKPGTLTGGFNPLCSKAPEAAPAAPDPLLADTTPSTVIAPPATTPAPKRRGRPPKMRATA